MKKSGYRSILHIYLIFFAALVSVVTFAVLFSFSMIRVHIPDGTAARSNYPKEFTENFREQIIFIEDTPRIKQSGLKLLQSHQAGIQILDDSGQEILDYLKPENRKDFYSVSDLLQLSGTGHISDKQTTSFVGSLTHNETDYIYIVHFPLNISKVTMYLNGDKFTTGKTIILLGVSVVFFIIIVFGYIYGLWITKTIDRMSVSVKEIAGRSYTPITNCGAFHDAFESLNDLDTEIKKSDKVKEETEKTRKEWIANITHDLKTPLSPVKGYAELLSEKDTISKEQIKKYSQVILKNVSCMESLMDDLKLTYQLDNGIIPIQREEYNVVRFIKELSIDILNNPEYESRVIHFHCANEDIVFSFDHKLMTRAIQNLIINAFTHGNEDTEVVLQISVANDILQIVISDNGNGMDKEEVNHLFQRYYRGTNTEKETAGTGLGLAITKSIVEAQGGTISVESGIGIGTDFIICFSLN